jgi:hypothetical protein
MTAYAAGGASPDSAGYQQSTPIARSARAGSTSNVDACPTAKVAGSNGAPARSTCSAVPLMPAAPGIGVAIASSSAPVSSWVRRRAAA